MCRGLPASQPNAIWMHNRPLRRAAAYCQHHTTIHATLLPSHLRTNCDKENGHQRQQIANNQTGTGTTGSAEEKGLGCYKPRERGGSGRTTVQRERRAAATEHVGGRVNAPAVHSVRKPSTADGRGGYFLGRLRQGGVSAPEEMRGGCDVWPDRH